MAASARTRAPMPDGALVDTQVPWCRSYVGSTVRRLAEPGHRPWDPVEVPAEVLAAKALPVATTRPVPPSTARTAVP